MKEKLQTGLLIAREPSIRLNVFPRWGSFLVSVRVNSTGGKNVGDADVAWHTSSTGALSIGSRFAWFHGPKTHIIVLLASGSFRWKAQLKCPLDSNWNLRFLPLEIAFKCVWKSWDKKKGDVSSELVLWEKQDDTCICLWKHCCQKNKQDVSETVAGKTRERERCTCLPWGEQDRFLDSDVERWDEDRGDSTGQMWKATKSPV